MPFHKLHCDLALENGLLLERHDCGKSEAFVPDWVEMGIRAWNPAQTTNDLKAIKQKYVGKLAICGGWDNLKYDASEEDELREALIEYVDTFAPGGGFTYMAMGGGPKDDPKAERRREIIKDVYWNYAHDYYKTHG